MFYDDLLKADFLTYQNDEYAKVYGGEFNRKINLLQDTIINGCTKPNEFTVFALEAGLGKSKYTNMIIDKNLSEFGNSKNFLVVKRFKEDVENMEKFLCNHNDDFQQRVLGITSDNWSSEWREKPEELLKIDALIITHKRYIDLCLDDDMRQYFCENREVLIIDEKVNFPIYSFSNKYYNELRAMLPSHRLQKEFDKVCKKLLILLEKQKIEKNQNKCVRLEPKIHPATVENFLKLMEDNLKDIKKLDDRNAIEKFLDGLKIWYSTPCVYNGGNITTFNRKHMLWGLQNNIILDASSSIDGVYHISDHYHVIGESRIIDHTNSSFNIVPFNTSKSNLEKYAKQFYPEIANKILEHHREADQTLIICHKDNYKEIYEQLLKLGIQDIHIANETTESEEKSEGKVTSPYAINWFGNLIGKNAYSNFTQCWVIATPNIPYEHYLNHYMMYTRKHNLGNKSLDIERGRFKNGDFRVVQVGYIASEIYQSIKRIQRNGMPKGEFFIVNHDKIILEKVFGEIKGSGNQNTISLKFMEEKKNQNQDDEVDKLIDHIRFKLPIGVHKKNQITSALNIDPKNFGRLIKRDSVTALKEHGYANFTHHTIEKLKNW